MRIPLIVLAATTLAPGCLASSPMRFDPTEFPFASDDPDIDHRQMYGLALSGDGTTVYGSYSESHHDDTLPQGVERSVIPWRWQRDTGYQLLDMSAGIASPRSILFRDVTHDGSHAIYSASGPFGTTHGLWTPNGVSSTQAFTNNEIYGRLDALSADGSAVLQTAPEGTWFEVWDGTETRDVSRPNVDWTFEGTFLSDDGTRVGGHGVLPGIYHRALWVYDQDRGFTTLEMDNTMFGITDMTRDASAILGIRIVTDDGYRSEAFVWDTDAGYRVLTPEGAVQGSFFAANADASLIAHSYTFAGEDRFFALEIDGLGEVPLLQGLQTLGFDLGAISRIEPHAFSDDGRVLLATEYRAGVGDVPVLVTTSTPSPGGTLVFLSCGLVMFRRRR